MSLDGMLTSASRMTKEVASPRTGSCLRVGGVSPLRWCQAGKVRFKPGTFVSARIGSCETGDEDLGQTRFRSGRVEVALDPRRGPRLPQHVAVDLHHVSTHPLRVEAFLGAAAAGLPHAAPEIWIADE